MKLYTTACHKSLGLTFLQMKYPGYLLNPGDMFQVDPERVMFATGAPKLKAKSIAPARNTEDGDEAEAEKAAPEPVEEVEDEVDDIDIDRSPREVLKDLQAQAKSILSTERDKIGAKKKQDLRGFTKAVKRMLSRSGNSSILTDSLEAQFEELKNQLRIQRQNKREGRTAGPSEQGRKATEEDSPDKPLAEAQLDAEEAPDPVTPDEEVNMLSDRDIAALQQALQTSIDNPIDTTKPYATPWRPRDYMSAFAFIPRYLEVNQNICAAVYLRHPVARPGLAETPTPFPLDVSSAAYVWYLRRR